MGIRSANDIKKDVLIFQPTTPHIIRVVLLHTEASGKRLFRGSVVYVRHVNIIYEVHIKKPVFVM